MSDKKYQRLVQTSVTIFLQCEDKVLMLKRGADKKVDANRLNGVGGRVEPGEDFLTATIRECEEETGIFPQLSDIQFSGLIKVEGGYAEDWVMGFFKIKVPTLELPIGTHTPDGELMWLTVDEVMNSDYELVDDLNFCFEDIIRGDKTIFATYQLNDDEKVRSFSRQDLSR